MNTRDELLKRIDEVEKESPINSISEKDFNNQSYLIQTFTTDKRIKSYICYLNGAGFIYTYPDKLEIQNPEEDGKIISSDVEAELEKRLEEPDTELAIIVEANTLTEHFSNLLIKHRKTLDNIYEELNILRGIGKFKRSFNYDDYFPVFLRNLACFKGGEPFIFSFDGKGILNVPKNEYFNLLMESQEVNTKLLDFKEYVKGTFEKLENPQRFKKEKPREAFFQTLYEFNDSTKTTPVEANTGYITYRQEYFSLGLKMLKFILSLPKRNRENSLNLPEIPKQGKFIRPSNMTFEEHIAIRQPFKEKAPGDYKRKLPVAYKGKEAITNLLEMKLKEDLSYFDKCVWDAFQTIIRTGNKTVTPTQIANFMYTGGSKNSIRKNSKLVKEITESINRLRVTECILHIGAEVDFYEEKSRAKPNGRVNKNAVEKYNGFKDIGTRIIRFNYIGADVVTGKTQNGYTDTLIIPHKAFTDIFINQYLEVEGQKTTISPKLIPNPLQATSRSISLCLYLIEKIGGMPFRSSNYLLSKKRKILDEWKIKKETDNRQLLTTMPGYEDCFKEEQKCNKADRTISIKTLITDLNLENTHHTRLMKDIEKILECWKDTKIIKSYTFNRYGDEEEGYNVKSITINIF